MEETSGKVARDALGGGVFEGGEEETWLSLLQCVSTINSVSSLGYSE